MKQYVEKPLVAAISAVLTLSAVQQVWAFKPDKHDHGHTMITSGVLNHTTATADFVNLGEFSYHGRPSGGLFFSSKFSTGQEAFFSQQAAIAITIGNQSTDYLLETNNFDDVLWNRYAGKMNAWVFRDHTSLPLDRRLWRPTEEAKSESSEPIAHCDDDLILECSDRIKELRTMAINSLSSAINAKNDLNKEKAQVKAWLLLGKALHTLQDFYAHSTFADAQESDSAYFTELTKEGLRNELIRKIVTRNADINVCQPRSEPNTPLYIQSFANNGGNWKIVYKEKYSTGYSDNLKSAGLNLGVARDTIASRCDHGFDKLKDYFLSSELSGIAKDDPYAPLTDHDPDRSKTSELHIRATIQAANHTKVFLEETVALIKQYYPDTETQDKMISVLLDVPVPAKNPIPESETKGSKPVYGFVIDTTGSMGDIIQGVRNQIDSKIAEAASKNANQQFMLITFNDNKDGDPSPYAGTSTPLFGKADFISGQVRTLNVEGGGDCPENAFGGTLKAVVEAPEGSTLYVFTDASANDLDFMEQLKGIANKKRITINPVVSGTCGSSSRFAAARSKKTGGQADTRFFSKPIKEAANARALAASYTVDQPYLDLAAATGGQVIQTEHDAASVEAALAGLDLTVELVNLKTIRAEQGTISAAKTVEFKLDDAATVLSVVATLDKGDVSFTSPSGIVVAGGKFKLLPFLGGTTLKAIDPSVGVWKVTFTPTEGETANYSVRAEANARADLKSIRFTGVAEIGRAGHTYYPDFGLTPIVGKNRVEVALTGVSTTDLKLKAVSDTGAVLAESVLKNTGGAYYETVITLPNKGFKLVIEGQNSAAASVPFERTFSTPITPDALLVGMIDSEPMLAGRQNLVTYRITNLGAKDTFSITAATDVGTISNLTASQLTLEPNQTAVVTFAVQLNATDVVGKDTLHTTFEVKGSTLEETQTVILNISKDADGDGVPDSSEKGQTGTDDAFDGNDDGTPDWKQNTVASLHSHQMNGYVTLSIRGSGVFASVKAQPTVATEKLVLPLDAFEMVITGVDSSGKTDVEFKLPDHLLAQQFYQQTNGEWANFTLSNGIGLKSAIANVLTVTLGDGATGDTDALKNGQIHFYGAPAELRFKGVATASPAEEKKKEPWYRRVGGCTVGDASDPTLPILLLAGIVMRMRRRVK